MRKSIVAILLLFAAPISMVAQTKDEDAVKDVIRSLFDGMREADSAKVRAVFAPSAMMQTIKSTGQNVAEVVSEKPDGFIQSIAKQSKGVLDEQITFDSFHSDGQLATVVTPYKFFYNGNFSHCGINAFQLVKFTDGWKIQYIIDTRRKTGCE